MLDRVILEDGRRKCPHCDKVQPAHKLGFIRHVAMEHEEVMENLARLARQFMDKLAKEKEEKDTSAEEELGGGKTEDENQTEASKTDVKKDQDGPTSDLIREKEKAIMEGDPIIEHRK